MIELNKRVVRKTRATFFDIGRRRKIIASLEDDGRSVGIRLEGTKRTYRLDIEALYVLAVKKHVEQTEKVAKRIKKNLGVSIRTARSKARKETAELLK